MTVKAWLKGHQFDLDTLADLFPAGDVRVVKECGDYYLTAIEISNPPNDRHFYEVAPEMLQRVNGMACAMRPGDFRPVELLGKYQVGEARHQVVQVGYAEGRGQALPVAAVFGSGTIEARAQVRAVATVTHDGQSVSQPPPPGPRYVALAAHHPDLAEALAIMGMAEPKWVDLYKVYEIVRDNIKPVKMEHKGWATKQEQSAFTGSANRKDVSGTDARHARNTGAVPVHTMSLQQARHFISDLVMRWIETLQP